MTGPLDVDGPRPAVAWVTSLPRTGSSPAIDTSSLVMALDTYDQRAPFTCRPGTAKLWAWTGWTTARAHCSNASTA